MRHYPDPREPTSHESPNAPPWHDQSPEARGWWRTWHAYHKPEVYHDPPASVYDAPQRPRAVYVDGDRLDGSLAPNGSRVPTYAPPEGEPFPWGTVKQSAFGIVCALGGALCMRGLDKLAAMGIIGPTAVAPRERTSSVPPRPKGDR